MLVAASHQMTGLNLCALGDSLEPFLASVVKRFESQFRAYIPAAQHAPAMQVAL
jgi:NADH:ubiquinone oxidoreductase subunit F (NADH-binding)